MAMFSSHVRRGPIHTTTSRTNSLGEILTQQPTCYRMQGVFTLQKLEFFIFWFCENAFSVHLYKWDIGETTHNTVCSGCTNDQKNGTTCNAKIVSTQNWDRRCTESEVQGIELVIILVQVLNYWDMPPVILPVPCCVNVLCEQQYGVLR